MLNPLDYITLSTSTESTTAAHTDARNQSVQITSLLTSRNKGVSGVRNLLSSFYKHWAQVLMIYLTVL